MDNITSEKYDRMIVRYLEGSASENECVELEQWLSLSPANRKHFSDREIIWRYTEELDIDTKKALELVNHKIRKNKGRRIFVEMIGKVAAVLFLPLLISTIWLGMTHDNNSSISGEAVRTIVAPFGTITSLSLPDGSKVWLNAGSTLEFPEKFRSGSREVSLNGEAFFEVMSDRRNPFYVNTGEFSVKATGTQFNVMAFQGQSYASVTLLEGKVAVIESADNMSQGKVTMLQPGQHLECNTEIRSHVLSAEDPYKYVAWKDGKLVFRDDRLSAVARRISIQYNVDIEIPDQKVRNYRYRATFENEPLSELLRLLKLSAPIDFREQEPQALPDGTFSRRTIIIFPTE